MAKSLTLRTDDATFSALEERASHLQRSKNHLANEALKKYLGTDSAKEQGKGVVTKLEDLAGDFWPEDDTADFLAFLEAERERSRNEPGREL